MAVYFELIDRNTGEIVPPAEADTRMRMALGCEPDNENWLAAWYNLFGLSLACGATWQKVEETWNTFPDVVTVVRYLASIYDAHNWRE